MKARPPQTTFAYTGEVLSAAGVSLDAIASEFGTPLYVYDWASIERAYQEFAAAFDGTPHLICASVKANSNISLLQRLQSLGSGFDIVSAGELQRVLKADGDPQRVVFSGVGKTADEMDAALAADILLFNVESGAELKLLADRALRQGKRARFGIRVNPDVAAQTHPHIATGLHRHKFGVEMQRATALYRDALNCKSLEGAGVSFHIGSQILATSPFAEAAARVKDLIAQLRRDGHPLRYFDIGGGLGISYTEDQQPPRVRDYALHVQQALAGLDCTLLMEPGRRLFGAAGVLLTRVLYIKENAGRKFVITDAGYNDFIRPVLYSAYHQIAPVLQRPEARRERVDIVGPICESADTFAVDRELADVGGGDLLAILDAGAYGFCLSSNYNTRPRPAEVLVDTAGAHLIRRRETLDDLLGAELPYLRVHGRSAHNPSE